MTFFNISDRHVTLSDSKPNVVSELPNGTYGLRFSPDIGLYLEVIDNFEMPSKIYGDIDTRAERIKTTYRSRKGVTGILLDGEKGSGKTLLGKKVALDLQKEGQPIIVVNMPVSGDMFGTFLQRLKKPVTLFIDEFEKIYNNKDQEGLLTILDGVYPLKVLAILTSNNGSKIADAMINRPGRIFYSLKYEGLDHKFAEEYTRDKLKDEARINEVMRLVTLSSINFDQLQALIEEMNRYNESAVDAVQMLNIDVEYAKGSIDIHNLIGPDGIEIPLEKLNTKTFYLGYDSNIQFSKENPSGMTIMEWQAANSDDSYYFLNRNMELKLLYQSNRNAVLPFIPVMVRVDMEDDDTIVEAISGGRLKVTLDSGYVIHGKRVKVASYKRF